MPHQEDSNTTEHEYILVSPVKKTAFTSTFINSGIKCHIKVCFFSSDICTKVTGLPSYGGKLLLIATLYAAVILFSSD